MNLTINIDYSILTFIQAYWWLILLCVSYVIGFVRARQIVAYYNNPAHPWDSSGDVPVELPAFLFFLLSPLSLLFSFVTNLSFKEK